MSDLTSHINITTPAAMAQEALAEEGRKDCKRENTGESAVNVSPRNDYIIKTGRMTISMDQLTWKGKTWVLTPRQRTTAITEC